MLLLTCFVSGYLMGNSKPDTLIYLDPVEILESRYETFSIGSNTRVLDSTDIIAHKGYDLSSLLNARSSIFVKGYGPGMLASPSLRGGSASQTALLWNGFNIQSPMHGQNDLSLFPLIFTDRVEVQHGNTGAVYGSGAVGSAISLSNQMEFNGKVFAETQLLANNIENYVQTFHIRAAGKRLAGTLRLFNQNAGNRFNYKNPNIPGSDVLERKHSEIGQKGFMNELYYRGNNNHAVVRLWYQDNERNIPPSLMQEHTGAFQHDQSLRITGNWNKLFENSLLVINAAYFDETILFTDSLGIESYSNSNTWIQEIEYRILRFNNHTISAGINNYFVEAKSHHYVDRLQINRYSVFSSWKWQDENIGLGLFGSIRQEWQDDMDIPIIPSLGLSYQVFNDFAIKANAGKNFRIPSLNDLYWYPGGNSDLLPERGWNQDVTFKYRKNSKHKKGIGFSEAAVTGFHRLIDNWIIWLPKGGLWTPQNVMKVRSTGLEATSAIKIKSQNSSSIFRLSYEYVSARNEKQKSPNDKSLGKQLIYVPKHSAGATVTTSYKSARLYYEHVFVGERFTSSDNLYSLDPFHTANIGVQYFFRLYETVLTLRFDIHNIWNESYMVVSGNPMPLRYYSIGINLTWDKQIW